MQEPECPCGDPHLRQHRTNVRIRGSVAGRAFGQSMRHRVHVTEHQQLRGARQGRKLDRKRQSLQGSTWHHFAHPFSAQLMSASEEARLVAGTGAARERTDATPRWPEWQEQRVVAPQSMAPRPSSFGGSTAMSLVIVAPRAPCITRSPAHPLLCSERGQDARISWPYDPDSPQGHTDLSYPGALACRMSLCLVAADSAL